MSNGAGKSLAKVPVLSKSPVDEALIGAGSMLGKLDKDRTGKHMQKLSEHRSSCVRTFVEYIEMVGKLYNNPMLVVFDKQAIYLGVAEE